MKGGTIGELYIFGCCYNNCCYLLSTHLLTSDSGSYKTYGMFLHVFCCNPNLGLYLCILPFIGENSI